MLSRLKFKIEPLVNEMLDQIPQDVLIYGKVLDPAMGGGQFVKEVERRKRAAGLTDEQSNYFRHREEYLMSELCGK